MLRFHLSLTRVLKRVLRGTAQRNKKRRCTRNGATPYVLLSLVFGLRLLRAVPFVWPDVDEQCASVV